MRGSRTSLFTLQVCTHLLLVGGIALVLVAVILTRPGAPGNRQAPWAFVGGRPRKERSVLRS